MPNDSRGPFRHLDQPAGLASVLLAPLSLLYAGGWWAYESMYRLGLKKPKEPHRPVLVVGNLTVGGTGKTPLTAYLAQLFRRSGHEVVLSASGYGSPASEEAQCAPAGPLIASRWGDEPAYYRWLMPDLPLIIGRNRVRAAEICAERFPNAILLLDDGFQHLPLKKHLALILDPDPAPNPLCLPAGPYRQPRSAGRRKADAVIPGTWDLVRQGPVFRDAEGRPCDRPATQPIQLLSAIGSPARLRQSFIDAGYELIHEVHRPDHDPLTAGNLWASFDPQKPILVTAKDWMKLRERTDLAPLTLWIVDYEVRLKPEPEFTRWLLAKIHEIEAKTD
ncbi:MAG TPA: tetraacyldisaccharide 4'-kinase [Fimbriimonadaceae bacterium]|nr:tetraacyldisaccharide 4'-kinase [Fimbriimonadaceae bacterium]HRJ33312.1 tetraacyldisaccharide 4'-kinase [Fimbriimonadaceae bacterium]